ncbi:C-terminal helicase domain-containing protein, partial [Falsihalocynthiibacter sp. S25ZX9]|uniref:C-terminal helicase domain-containing protein n=1 Tax=Falsihalocynthiibacter sp. S25ZX9 TaxID=3240870 RepID=UPI00350EC7B9
KSQGRYVDTVFIDTSTVFKRPVWLSPEMHKRLLYTAVTRAREQVVFYEMAGCCEGVNPKSKKTMNC